MYTRAAGTLGRVSDLTPATPDDGRNHAESSTAGAPAEVADGKLDLEALVGQWLTVPEVAERFDVPLAQVRRLIEDRVVLASRIGPRRVVAVPERFFDDEGPRADLPGTFTVLADGGMRDDEIIEWLFTPDPTLPVGGAPIDNLWAGHKTEIRRRAQELAF